MIEMFQVVEMTEDSKKTYAEKWDRCFHDSSTFADSTKQGLNTRPAVVPLGCSTMECSNVQFGEGFTLPTDLVAQCLNFQMAAKRVGDQVTATHEGHACTFVRFGDMFFHRPGVDLKAEKERLGDSFSSSGSFTQLFGSPRVGDLRIMFEVIPDEKVSVLAVQTTTSLDTFVQKPVNTFVPFRLVTYGLAGLTPEQERLAVRQAGLQPRALGDSFKWVQSCLFCFPWRTMLGMLTEFWMPQVYCAAEGTVSKQDMLKRVICSTGGSGCCARTFAWVLTFSAWWIIFRPVIGLYVESTPLVKQIGLGEAMNELVVALGYTIFTALLCRFTAQFPYAPKTSLAALGSMALLAALWMSQLQGDFSQFRQIFQAVKF